MLPMRARTRDRRPPSDQTPMIQEGPNEMHLELPERGMREEFETTMMRSANPIARLHLLDVFPRH
eukprot:6959686-Pyramimonas_sp.AAC.1